MTEPAGLEKALQATIERLIESRLGLLRQDLDRELQAEISAALGHSPQGGASAAAGSSAASAFAALNQSIARILQPTGQSEVMEASLQAAAGVAGRCALFVRRGEAYAFWRAERFPDQSIGSLRSLTIPVGQAGIFKEITERPQPLSRLHAPGVLPEILERALGNFAQGNLYLLPVVVQSKVIAALYADAGSAAGSVEPSALEIIARVAGLSLETIAARAASRPAAAVGTSKSSPAAAVADESLQPIETFAPGAEGIAASAGQTSPPPGSFAASIPASSEGDATLSPPPDLESLPEADRDGHRKAHRFARVAVQDLLSYHKAKIEQGRKNKNLYLTLKEDIEKIRENYKQRFGQTAARSFDYLHYEMVLHLAGNDAATLGAQYPGPSQSE